MAVLARKLTYEACLQHHKVSRSPHPPARILKVYIGALSGSVTYSKSVVRIMGLWWRKLFLTLGIITLIYVSSCVYLHCCCGVCLHNMQPGSSHRGILHVYEISCWPFTAHCRTGACKTVRASHRWWSVGGGHGEDLSAGWPASWTQAIRGCPHFHLSLECNFCPQFSQGELFSRTQAWEDNVLLRPSGWTWLNTVMASR